MTKKISGKMRKLRKESRLKKKMKNDYEISTNAFLKRET